MEWWFDDIIQNKEGQMNISAIKYMYHMTIYNTFMMLIEFKHIITNTIIYILLVYLLCQSQQIIAQRLVFCLFLDFLVWATYHLVVLLLCYSSRATTMVIELRSAYCINMFCLYHNINRYKESDFEMMPILFFWVLDIIPSTCTQ